MNQWRNRRAEERLQALLQESLAVDDQDWAMSPAICPRNCRYHGAADRTLLPDRRHAVDNRARERVKLSQKLGVELRQSMRGRQV